MLIIPREALVIRDRQRKQILPAPLNELKESILQKTLLNPPVVWPLAGDESKYLLIAGEHRMTAIDLIAKEGKSFSCNSQTIEPGFIPVTVANLSSDVLRREAEFDENVIRVDLTWQERAAALSDIHKLRKELNPEQTFLDTGTELANKGAGTPMSLRNAVRESVLIAEHLNDPTISKARNASEAHSLLMKREEERVNTILAKRQLSKLAAKPEIEVRHADALELLPRLEAQQFDLILTDPPYGIDASGGGFRSRTVHHHNYEDTAENARAIAEAILVEGFRLSKLRANLFLFTDIKHWDWLQRTSAQVGWKPFRRPLIWGKSDSEGLAPWGAQGPRITTEFIFFATKGEKGLLASPIDYIRINRVPRHERIHAAEKPVELLRKLIECSTLPGDRILDACCGSGSTLVAARELRRQALGIEKDESYYNTAMSNIHMGKSNGSTSGDSQVVSEQATPVQPEHIPTNEPASQ